ncbi:MAG: ammonium transporter [Candidatus Tectomicrobia bacterium]|uniref:Ammonium transporter n=1 Tax=Tectimicrobiota bacterium TaxID=2528274 RepID=A0A937VWV7_UNCTE|nr:ammonium transporter [Candidatus Tectomicrobia bacterium]
MKRRRSFSRWMSAATGLWMLISLPGAWAQDTRPMVASEAAATAAPTLPAYFTATNDAQKPAWPDPTGGASGVWATPAGDAKGDVPEQLKMTDLYDRIVHNLYAINYVWVLIAGALVMFMQAGFMLVETALCRAKNAAHTSAMNLMIYPLGCLAFWAYGFALGWGNWWNGPVPPGWYPALGPGLSLLNEGSGLGAVVDAAGKATGAFTYGLVGLKGWFLSHVGDVSVMTMFFFMMVFMDTTATIPTGAMAERWAWKNFCLYGLWVALPYCLFANWVWGGGWLAQAGLNWGLGHGAVDFAGSGVVHAMGGVIGLVGAMLIGPRLGKYSADGRPMAMPGHNVVLVVAGTFILAFGWFGFNPGSTLAGTDLRISFIVVNTMLAGVMASVAAMLTLMLKGQKPDPTMCCNGMLAGLVAVTAPCAFITPLSAAIIGLVAGYLVVVSVFFWERRGIDDPVGAISVHGVNGIWGVLAVGIFANGEYGAGWNGVVRDEFVKMYGSDGVRGLLYGDASQFMAQLLSAAVVLVFGFVMAYAWFKISNLITPLRVSKEVEVEGLDGPEMGVPGYPDFQHHPSAAGQPMIR